MRTSYALNRYFPFAVSLEPIQARSAVHFNVVPPLSSAQADFVCLATIFLRLKTVCHASARGKTATFGTSCARRRPFVNRFAALPFTHVPSRPMVAALPVV